MNGSETKDSVLVFAGGYKRLMRLASRWTPISSAASAPLFAVNVDMGSKWFKLWDLGDDRCIRISVHTLYRFWLYNPDYTGCLLSLSYCILVLHHLHLWGNRCVSPQSESRRGLSVVGADSGPICRVTREDQDLREIKGWQGCRG